MDGEDRTGRERKERLRARRDEAGMAQVSGWVPKERRPYARKVLAALARGVNSLPPDPEQAAALDAAQIDTAAARAAEAEARAALAGAEQHRQTLMAELKATRAESEAALEAERRAGALTTARAEAAEQAQEVLRGKLQVAEKSAATAKAVIDQIREIPGPRGKLVAFLIRKMI